MFKFSQTLSEFPSVGQIFVVSGYSTSDAQGLKIILSCGRNLDANAALVIAPSFANKRITRSALINQSMENTEEDENLTCKNVMPIGAGEQFTFTILVGNDRFHIAVNDEKYCEFNFKIPPEYIRSVLISGDVDSLIKVNHLKTFPYIFPCIRSDYEDLAFEGFIPREYEPGHLLLIHGSVNGKSDSDFTIMFLEDESKRQLIHFNPRFDEDAVVMNSMVDEEGWSDNEIRSQNNPFALGQQFRMAFAFTPNDVKVAVNGYPLMSFPLSCIFVEENDTLWEILTGFRVKNGADINVKIDNVEHIQMGNNNCEGFESYTALVG